MQGGRGGGLREAGDRPGRCRPQRGVRGAGGVFEAFGRREEHRRGVRRSPEPSGRVGAQRRGAFAREVKGGGGERGRGGALGLSAARPSSSAPRPAGSPAPGPGPKAGRAPPLPKLGGWGKAAGRLGRGRSRPPPPFPARGGRARGAARRGDWGRH